MRNTILSLLALILFVGCESDGDFIYLPQQDQTYPLNNDIEYNIIELSSTGEELIVTIDIELGTSSVNSFWLELDFYTDSSHETKISTKKVPLCIPAYDIYRIEISLDSTHYPDFSVGNFNAWCWAECLCVNEP